MKITKKNVAKIKSQKWTTSKKTVATVRPAPSYKTYDDKSNIGAEREVTIKGGTSQKMKIKDNGTVRKELSSQDLADWYMGLGINLGNTMEAQLSMAKRAEATEATQFETAWGQPVTTQKYIDCIHSYGINTLRIPVAWSNMVNEEKDYEINEKYLGRVEEIVNYALNDGMYAIINIHWDNQWWGQFGACKLLEDGKTKVPDEERRAAAWKRFESYWKQISERFKNYSDHLIFQSANEELGDRLNDEIYSNGYSATLDLADTMVRGNLSVSERYETTNKINQKFVDIVRAPGGNNAYRHLLVQGYNTNIGKTADDRFKMPTDSKENGKSKLSLSVHYYEPWDFCGDDGAGDYDPTDKESMGKSFSTLRKFSDNGYAIIISECGVVEPGAVQGNVTQWYRDAYAECQKIHAVPVLWEKGTYFNRGEAKCKYKDMAELWNEITGAKGDTSMTRLTGKANAPKVETIKIDKDKNEPKPVWTWTGKWYKNGGDYLVGDDRYEEGGGTKINNSEADDVLLSKFVPESKVTPTIEGDATSIEFNPYGYHAFIKFDLTKYKKPAIAFEFMDGTANEGIVGNIKYAADPSIKEESENVILDYFSFAEDKALILDDNVGLSADKPYLHITFSSKPTVMAIKIYETAK